MTRSVEIPEAALNAALVAAGSTLLHGDPVAQMRAGLLAALPYLAPAGDGGLREALEQTAREKIAEWYGAKWSASEDKFYETYDGGGISCVDEEAMLELRGVRLALDLALAAHPTAPAVPQPVDREALRKQIESHRMTSSGTAWKDASCKCGWTGLDYWPHQTAMILAVLAGEQEQVEP